MVYFFLKIEKAVEKIHEFSLRLFYADQKRIAM